MKNLTTNPEALTVGIDIGDQKSVVTFLNATGDVIEQGKIPTTLEGFRYKFGDRAPIRIAFETGTHSPWIYDLLSSLGHETVVANSRKLHLISKSIKKNDKNDSMILARLARMDPQMLSPVQHRATDVRRDLTLFRVRDKLVGTRTSLILSIRFLCKSFGYRLPNSSAQSFVKKVAPGIPTELRSAVTSMIQVLVTLNEQINTIDQKLQKLATEKYPVTQLLQQIHGVGPMTALCFVLVIGDPTRFSRGRKVASYIGLTPRQHQSGEHDPSLPISKAGDAGLRRLLVQCSHHILGPFGPDSDLRRHGERMIQRQGPSGKKKAVVAVARKLAITLHHLWLTGEEYNPLWQSEQKTLN